MMLNRYGFQSYLTSLVYSLVYADDDLWLHTRLTKTKLKGRKIIMFMIVFTMFFSGGIIPEYILIKELHLLDNMIW